MPLELLLHGLQCECELGLLTGTTCTGPLRLPGHHRPEQLVHPCCQRERSALSSQARSTLCHPKSIRAETPRVVCGPWATCRPSLGTHALPARFQARSLQSAPDVPPRVRSVGPSPQDARGQDQRAIGKMGAERHCARPASASPRLHGAPPCPVPAASAPCREGMSGLLPGALGLASRPAGLAADDGTWPAKSPGPDQDCGGTHLACSAIATGLRQREQGFGSVTDQGRDRRAQRLEPGSHSTAPVS